MFCVSTKFLRPIRVKMAAGCSFETLVTCCCLTTFLQLQTSLAGPGPTATNLQCLHSVAQFRFQAGRHQSATAQAK